MNNDESENCEIAVLCESARRIEQAKSLAGDLNAPLFLGVPLGDFPFLLALTDERVELRMTGEDSPGPVHVDFTSGPIDYRRHHGGSQMILKAIGGSGKNVLDVTAGLGRDAFILASLGCTVTAFEKSQVLTALVQDALGRARQIPEFQSLCARLDFHQGDSKEVLSKAEGNWDVIYLDPMFPKKEKSALPKKELQVLQKILGVPEDESEARDLLALAGKCARRVVVKRHIRSPELREGVSTVFKGASTRFDVYLFT